MDQDKELSALRSILPTFKESLLVKKSMEAEKGPWLKAAYSAFAHHVPSASDNIHAVGVGLKSVGGKYQKGLALKVYVFRKIEASAFSSRADLALKEFEGAPVDVEEMPIPVAQARASADPDLMMMKKILGVRPLRYIIGPGAKIRPAGKNYYGTLGCFVKKVRKAGFPPSLDADDELYVLSNNHVLADVNTVPLGTEIEFLGYCRSTALKPVPFAELSQYVNINFTGINLVDAAIARVTKPTLCRPGKISTPTYQYNPDQVASPVPGMKVLKAGARTCVTKGTITAIDVDGVNVNYGTGTATFDNTVIVVGETVNGTYVPFSLPGDSGSVVVYQGKGYPVAHLFAGNGYHTITTTFSAVMKALHIKPA